MRPSLNPGFFSNACGFYVSDVTVCVDLRSVFDCSSSSFCLEVDQNATKWRRSRKMSHAVDFTAILITNSVCTEARNRSIRHQQRQRRARQQRGERRWWWSAGEELSIQQHVGSPVMLVENRLTHSPLRRRPAKEALLLLLESGAARRKVGTRLNSQSSRSQCVRAVLADRPLCASVSCSPS